MVSAVSAGGVAVVKQNEMVPLSVITVLLNEFIFYMCQTYVCIYTRDPPEQ